MWIVDSYRYAEMLFTDVRHGTTDAELLAGGELNQNEKSTHSKRCTFVQNFSLLAIAGILRIQFKNPWLWFG